MVMAMMDLAPLAWCCCRALRYILLGTAQTATVTESLRPTPNNHEVALSNTLSEDMHSTNISTSAPDVLVEAAEFIASTMKKWSPAYQLNELIMRRVDGCIFSHASFCTW